jgi:hypothetical protein
VAWRTLGENVGTGYDADSLFNAYWNSPPHRANLLNPAFRFLGMGWVERPGGQGFNTQNFVSHYSTTYGRSRVPAFGGRGDSRTLTTTQSIAAFEAGSDARVAATATRGLSSRVTVDSPTAADNAARIAVRETGSGVGGAAGMFIRDSVQLRNAKSITIRVRANTRTGRRLAVQVAVQTVLGSHVQIGSFYVPSGTTRTVTMPLPDAGQEWRNQLTVVVPRWSLRYLSDSRTYRSATVAVHDIQVNV